MKKFVLRHWRGNGMIIADIMKDWYYDYPKHPMNRNAGKTTLAQCIHKVISEDEYLEEMLKISVEHHNKMVLKHGLGSWKLIKT